MAKAALVETTEPQTGLQRVTAAPERFIQFIKETRQEMRKVWTPSLGEVQNTTIVVIITVFFFAAFFELVDLTLGAGIDHMFVFLTKH